MHSQFKLIFSLLKEGLDPGQIVTLLTLRNAIDGCEDVLDVGCGKTNNMRRLAVKHSTGIDGYAPYLEEAKRKNLHDQYVLGDVRELEKYFEPGQFDTVLAMDVIEHLPKEDGLRMMRSMEKIARRKVVLFTPCGFLPQKSYENNDLQEHLSGWEPAEMEQYGYKVIGVLGPKCLRGELHALKGRPKIFWGIVSLLGHFFWTNRVPSKAAAILCVKTKS